MFTVEMLEAYEGDALWVEYGEGDEIHRMLIDAGRKKTYKDIVMRIEKLDKPLELFVMTHIDDDHIYGAIPLLADQRITSNSFKDVWYNGFTHLDPEVARRPSADILGPKNGEIFAGLLLAGGYIWNKAFDDGASVVVEDNSPLPFFELDGGMRLTLLSPGWEELKALEKFWKKKLEDMEPGDAEAALEIFADRRDLQPDILGGSIDIEGILDADEEEEDSKEPNGSSIAFLAEYKGQSVLFSGDAHPNVLEASIKRLLDERCGGDSLKLDAFKVSHHGSKNNISTSLLELLDCHTFLISTNGSRHHHPDKEALARIVNYNRNSSGPTKLYFNYRSDESNVWDDDDARDDWNFETYYPPEGYQLKLST